MKSVDISGMPELRRKLLRALPPATQTRVREAITETTEAVYTKAKARVKRRTGKGAASIRRRVNKQGTRGFVTHSRRTFWLRFLEFGTRSHGKGGGPLPAQPWLYPSLEEESGPHVARLRRAMQATVQDVAE
ncbi:hypothetical protein [Longimicrobium sp.]|jgi:hypothetical protein|uniref:hypothetical protein n=1 Tax=Longimicrobium sp. TaxID=2029185 RepID=UPI002F92C470